MDEFVCLIVRSQPGENQGDFAGRLSRFWTHMLRIHKADFERVYAENTSFEREKDCLTRKYLVTEDGVEPLQSHLSHAGVNFLLPHLEELYSRYEAVAPEWMQIEH